MGIFPLPLLGLKYVGEMEVDQTGVGEQVPICLCSQVGISMAIPVNKEILYFLTKSCSLIPGCLTSTRLDTKQTYIFSPFMLATGLHESISTAQKKSVVHTQRIDVFKGYAPFKEYVPNISRYTCHRMCPTL